MTFNPF